MDRDPKISVVILSYNFAAYIRECIESVLNQTLRPYEIIICDDASLDGTRHILEQYAKRYFDLIKIHIQEQNLGLPNHANFAFKQATGDLISWMDGDDRWLPRKLEVEWKALKDNPAARVAYSNVYGIDSSGQRSIIWYDGKGPLPPSGDIFVPVFSRKVFPNTTSIFRNHLFYRDYYDQIVYFDNNLEHLWDWDEKIRLANRYHIVYTGEALIEYRSHPGGFSNQAQDKNFEAFVKIYEKHVHVLDQRATHESVMAKCRLESLISKKQIRLSPDHYKEKYSCLAVYLRHYSAVNSMGDSVPEDLRSLFKRIEYGAIIDFISTTSRKTVLSAILTHSLFWNSEITAANIIRKLLPCRLYKSVRLLYKYLKGNNGVF